MFYTWCLDAPYVHTPPVHLYTPRDVHPYMSPYSSVYLYVLRGFCMFWGVVGGPYMWDTSLTLPLYGGASLYVYTPHLLVGFPVHQYVLGISTCDMGNISFMFGVWGVFPHLLGVWGHQHKGCPYASSCMFL